MSTPTFRRLSVEQFAQILDRFPFERRINAVHMHHTWRPTRRDFRGHDTIVGMWRHHTQVNGWRDIAQHLTIDPEGMVWLGRNWNLPPASAAGHNGNSQVGPFMFEMIGDFDVGRDVFDGPQRDAALEVTALVLNRFDLPTSALALHNSMSSKSCPGSSIDYADVRARVDAMRATRASSRAVFDGPFPYEEMAELQRAMSTLLRVPAGVEPADAEHQHGDQRDIGWTMERGGEGADRFPPDLLAALQPHLVNTSMGRFSADGIATTSKADVDAIFDVHLPTALKQAEHARRKLRLLFYAHGGLVDEASGLDIAVKHIDWWRRNDIYPVYFVWQTGLFETLGNLLRRASQGPEGRRDVFDFTLDPVIELSARALRGPDIWAGMKSNAEHAVDPPGAADGDVGAAWYVAQRLAAFCKGQEGKIALHAVGHSAGSIFHAHFLAAAREHGVPPFESAHFYAPAIRVDTFKRLLGGHIGPGKAVNRLTLFTLNRYLERKDHCAHVYHKSLLYLVSRALEKDRDAAILGLEDCLREDPGLRELFGLSGNGAGVGEIVWSRTDTESGSASSTATSHGGFDDDAPTLNSTVRRILEKGDSDPIVEYPRPREGPQADGWKEGVTWPEEVLEFHRGAQRPALNGGAHIQATVSGSNGFDHGGVSLASGRRVALCVGINAYPDPEHRLQACVPDARLWSQTLAGLGFGTRMLLDGAATRGAIDAELRAMVRDSRPGDVIVFQFSGHGTHVEDINGDELDRRDEALCPVNFAEGQLYIDDDIAEIFAAVPEGVNFTCFIDCCHSGTNTRFAVGTSPGGLGGSRHVGTLAKPRYVRPTPELEQAHRDFRRALAGGARGIEHATTVRMDSGGTERMRNVAFAACRDDEVAWERDGQGDFTLRATQVLRRGINGMTHEDFIRRVIAEFGPQPSQHPRLDCAPAMLQAPLLQPLGAAVPAVNGIAGQPMVSVGAMYGRPLLP